MSVTSRTAPSVLGAMLTFVTTTSFAQDRTEVKLRNDSSKFFFDAPESDETLDKTGYDGSLTLTTMFFSESSGQLDLGGGAPVENASNVNRFFTDMRARLDADHIGGGNWDFRLDIRGRVTPGSCRDLGDQLLDPLSLIHI